MIQFYVKKGDVIDFNVIHSDFSVFFKLSERLEKLQFKCSIKSLIRQCFVYKTNSNIYREKWSHDARILCHEIYLYKYLKILFMLLCIWRTSTACIRFVYEWQYRVLCNKELKGSTLNKKPNKVNITPTNITGINAHLAKTYFFLLFQTLKKLNGWILFWIA